MRKCNNPMGGCTELPLASPFWDMGMNNRYPQQICGLRKPGKRDLTSVGRNGATDPLSTRTRLITDRPPVINISLMSGKLVHQSNLAKATRQAIVLLLQLEATIRRKSG